MAHSFGLGGLNSLTGLVARANWWLIGAIVLGLAFWVAVISAGRALIA